MRIKVTYPLDNHGGVYALKSLLSSVLGKPVFIANVNTPEFYIHEGVTEDIQFLLFHGVVADKVL